jgi:hypothetical protein
MRSGWNWRLSGKRRKRAVLMLEPQGRSHPMRPNEQDTLDAFFQQEDYSSLKEKT